MSGLIGSYFTGILTCYSVLYDDERARCKGGMRCVVLDIVSHELSIGKNKLLINTVIATM